ncbi:hypothetical protein DUP93_09835 [Salmonella enterica subsp. enterica serovar Toulon]|nr:hypothetical protein [Salmonella enterica subsp. enterica serovar Toulon]
MKRLIPIALFGYLILSVNAFSTELSPIAQLVKKTLEERKLLVSPECTDYLYIPDNEPGVDVVNVIEKHGGSCPGDPQTQPRLFSVSVDKKTHKMESDINDPEDGTFSPLSE